MYSNNTYFQLKHPVVCILLYVKIVMCNSNGLLVQNVTSKKISVITLK